MNQFIIDLFTNYYLMAPIASWMVAQVLKSFTGVFKQQKFTVRAFLFGTGGMPSSHTAAVCGLFTACLIKSGIGAVETAMCAVFAMVVIIDAVGVRQVTGKQSRALNIILEDLIADPEQPITRFKELIGHTPLQVFFGAVTGVAVTALLYLIPAFQNVPA